MGLAFTVRETPVGRWQVVNADDEVKAEFDYLNQAEEDIIVRTLASFFIVVIQEAMDSDVGEFVWAELIHFLGPHDGVEDRCESCDRIITNLMPRAALMMSDSFSRGAARLAAG